MGKFRDNIKSKLRYFQELLPTKMLASSLTFCKQDISKSVSTCYLKLGQLIIDDN